MLLLSCIYDTMLVNGTAKIALVDAGFLRGQSSHLHQNNRQQKRKSRVFNEATTRPHPATIHRMRRHRLSYLWWRLNKETKISPLLFFACYSILYNTNRVVLYSTFFTLVFDIILKVSTSLILNSLKYKSHSVLCY